MIPVPTGVRVWLATGATDMRRGMNGLALQVQEGLGRDPHAGDLYVFRGRRGDLIKVLWHDGLGMSLYAKRLERGRFLGRRPPTVWCRSPPPSSAICSKGSIGAIRSGRIGRRPPDRSTQPRLVVVESLCEPGRSPRIGRGHRLARRACGRAVGTS